MRAVQGDLPGEGHHACARSSTSAPPPRRRACSRRKSRSDCIRCDKPFGVKSTIERVSAKLEGKHWMFKGSARRLDVIKMCEDCRVAVMAEEDFDPYGKPRPPVRTTEDYLREREEPKRWQTRAKATAERRRYSSSPSPETSPARRDPRPSRWSAPASWCRACRPSGRPRTASPPSPASRRCRASSAPARNCSRAASRSCGRKCRASVGPARLPSSGVERVAGDAGAEHLRAAIVAIGRQRIVGAGHRHLADVIAGDGVPAADHAVGAAGEQRAVVRQERHRPHRQARTDQRARERARRGGR